MVISAVIGGLLYMIRWKNPEGQEWLLLMSLDMFGYFAVIYD
jgi:hypothetical protein